MNKLIGISIMAFLMIGFSAHAGGMIGGGEVTFKSLVTCDAMGIDPTFESSPFVWVVKEVDFNGQFVPGATLRVVTLDQNLAPVLFHVSQDSDLVVSPDNVSAVQLWKHEGSAERTGMFSWDENSNTGSLAPMGRNSNVEELRLSNCIFEL